MDLDNMIFQKLAPKHSLVSCLYHLSTSGRSKIKSKQEHQEGWLFCHGHAITVKNDRRHDQIWGSRGVYFFLVSQRIILENYGSQF